MTQPKRHALGMALIVTCRSLPSQWASIGAAAYRRSFAMIGGLSSTISSLRAHDRKMNVNANNIANVNTNGFKRDRAVLQEGQVGDVRVSLTKDMSPAPKDPLAPDAPGVEKELSNVDLADELTGMIPTEIGYKANLKTIRSRDEMIGTLLDTLA